MRSVAVPCGFGPRGTLCGMALEFRLPDIGEGLTEAEIVDWLVAVGDDVAVNQAIVEVETAKTTVEIPSPQAGIITRLIGAPGDTVAVGEVLFVVGGESPVVGPQSSAEDEPSAVDLQPSASEPEAQSSRLKAQSGERSEPRAMPIVRKLARERGIDLAEVVGSGPDGAVTRADLEAFEPSDAEESLTPLSSIRRAIAVHMTQSWTSIPHVTVQAEVRAEALLADRDIRTDKSLPIEPLVAMAAMPLLRQFPDFNAAFEDGSVDYKDRINVGFAVDTAEGLMVVVIKDADRLGLSELTTEFERVSAAAIGRTATPDELTGQTFTISNIGALGGGHGTPIIPVGTSAIVSIGRANQQPVVENGDLAVGWVAPLDLSYDHRLIDGGLGQRFLGSLVNALETSQRDR